MMLATRKPITAMTHRPARYGSSSPKRPKKSTNNSELAGLRKASCEGDRSFERLSFNGAAGQPYSFSLIMPEKSSENKPEPLPWKTALAIAAETAQPWHARYGADGVRVIIRALQRVSRSK